MHQLCHLVVYRDGKVYTDQGDAVDVSDPAAPFPLGVFAFPGPIDVRDGKTIVGLASGIRDFMDRPTHLRVLDLETFASIRAVPLPAPPVGPSGFRGRGSELVYLGGDGVAFLAESEIFTVSLFIAHAPILGP